MQPSRSDSIRAILATGLIHRDDWHAYGLSSIRELSVVLEKVAQVMAELGYPPKDIFGARLALEEAIYNAIRHGHRHDPSKVVEVRYCIRTDHFLLEVEDQGPGFDPSQVLEAKATANLDRVCGRGLLLMRRHSAWVRYNREGNCVTLCIIPSEVLPVQEATEPLLAIVK